MFKYDIIGKFLDLCVSYKETLLEAVKRYVAVVLEALVYQDFSHFSSAPVV